MAAKDEQMIHGVKVGKGKGGRIHVQLPDGCGIHQTDDDGWRVYHSTCEVRLTEFHLYLGKKGGAPSSTLKWHLGEELAMLRSQAS